ncbi:MAG: DUF1840 domain-containing protein [Burkholderiaceae bacterium]
MIYEFKSRATGTITMTEAVGESMLVAMGREPAPRGAITVAQLPDAIAALRTASEAPEAQPAEPVDDRADGDQEQSPVSFARRALPLIEMFEAALQAGRDVTWGA